MGTVPIFSAFILVMQSTSNLDRFSYEGLISLQNNRSMHRKWLVVVARCAKDPAMAPVKILVVHEICFTQRFLSQIYVMKSFYFIDTIQICSLAFRKSHWLDLLHISVLKKCVVSIFRNAVYIFLFFKCGVQSKQIFRANHYYCKKKGEGFQQLQPF